MELIKRKRTIENYKIRFIPEGLQNQSNIDTTAPNYFYGKIPDFKVNSNWEYKKDENGNNIPNTVDIDIFLTQNFDDMGIFTDEVFEALTPYLNILQKPSDFNSFVYGRHVEMVGTATTQSAPLEFYIADSIPFSGTCDDRNLEYVESYKLDNSGNYDFNPGLNLAEDIRFTFDGVTSEDTIIGADVTYILGGDINPMNGNLIPNTGVRFVTFKNLYTNTEDQEGNPIRYKTTNFYSPVGGINNNNVILSALTKQEEYSGIVFKPEVDSDVFINRGVENIFEKHAMLSEIKTIQDIDNNRGGYLRT